MPNSRHVRVKLSTDGRLKATLPSFAPLVSLTRLIDDKRSELRKLVKPIHDTYVDGQSIGHSHKLALMAHTGSAIRGSITHQIITVSYPSSMAVSDPEVQSCIKAYVARALRIESKAYLPRRLKYLADNGGFHYERVRFAHQSGRWGSCSTSGTISLNIALMNLPFELIDYVLVHELAHTVEMNHSDAFWAVVDQYCPGYKEIRRVLKTRNPYL